ncbi:MAG: hypothetical protein GX153_12190 [Clostridiaceae bacterium]|nr:hypothetical protein [Clostridiaceae bacterium]
MRTRVLRITLVAVAVALLSASLLSTLLIERQVSRELRGRLDAVLAVAAAQADDVREGIAADPEGVADRIAADLSAIGQDIRITLIALDGTVLADSASDGPVLETHGARREVVDAIAT